MTVAIGRDGQKIEKLSVFIKEEIVLQLTRQQISNKLNTVEDPRQVVLVIDSNGVSLISRVEANKLEKWTEKPPRKVITHSVCEELAP